jgi:ribonuclease Z
MIFQLTVLGSSSAIPTATRLPSAQLLNIRDRLFLIDCAEGTQMQLRKYGLKAKRIQHIFISHLHGDHYLGLTGLIYTLHIFGRTETLHIYANQTLEEIIRLQLSASETTLSYPLVFHTLSPGQSEIILDNDIVSVRSVPLQHRIPTHGFVFREKPRLPNLNRELIEKLNIPWNKLQQIREGSGYTDDAGNTYSHEELTIKAATPRTYGYCSDTAFDTSLIPYFHNVDLLYHEATFGENKALNAQEKMHSTAMQAAEIASRAGVKALLIGHYSARYENSKELLDEARSIFSQSYAAEDGLSVNISELHAISLKQF